MNGNLRLDWRLAWRRLKRHRLSAVLAAIVLGGGLAIGCAVGLVHDEVLFQPPAHVSDPTRVAELVVWDRPGQRVRRHFSYGELLEVSSVAHEIGTLAVYTDPDTASIAASSPMNPTLVGGSRRAFVSTNFFSVLGVAPAAGRFFSSSRDLDLGAGEREIIVSLELWQELRSVGVELGQPVTVGGHIYSLVGVAPRGFGGVTLETASMWIPIAFLAEEAGTPLRAMGGFSFSIAGRLRSGLSKRQAGAVVNRLLTGDVNVDDNLGPRVAWWDIRQLRWSEHANERLTSYLLVIIAAMVVLLASGNAIALLTSHIMKNSVASGIQRALGASAARLARQDALEITTILLGAAVVAVAASLTLARQITSLAFPGLEGAMLMTPTLQSGLFLSAFLVSSILLVGFITLTRCANHLSLGQPRYSASQRHKRRLYALMVAGQSGLTFVLIAGGLLFYRTVQTALSERIGLDIRNLIYLEVVSPRAGGGVDPHMADSAIILSSRIANLPDVRLVASSSALPLRSLQMIPVREPNATALHGAGGPFVTAVSPNYFAATSTPILAGRAFNATDITGSEFVAVVSKALARSLWPGRSAIGQCLELGPAPFRCYRVVGIADDAPGGRLRDDPPLQYYVPAAQRPDLMARPYVLVKLSPGSRSEAALAAIRQMTRPTGRDGAGMGLGRFEDLVEPEIRPWRAASHFLFAVGCLATLVASAGLFAATFFQVRRRYRELAIRMALGASPGSILALVARRTLASAALGSVAGGLVMWSVGRQLEAVLYKVTVFDAAANGLGLALTMGSAFIAVMLPARFATRTQLTRALSEHGD